jgi:tetratricopeptide (TPR) repeat protein
MTRQSIRLLLGSVVALMASAPVLAQMALPDRIVLHGGQRYTGIKIKSANVDTITFTRFDGTGPERSVDASKVEELSWGDSPGDFRRAVADAKAGNHERALENLARCPAEGPRGFWYQPYRSLLEAQCLVETSQPAKALPKLETVVQRYRTSYYVLDAIQLKATVHTKLGQYDKAAETSLRLDPQGSFDKIGANKPYGKLRQLQGVAGAIESYVKAPGKQSQAAALLPRLVKVTGEIAANPPDDLTAALPEIRAIQQRAIVMQADLLVSSNQLDAARTWINNNAGRVQDRSARLRLFMTLGDMAMKSAGASGVARDRKASLYTQAVLAYMRVYVLYPDIKELRGRAMFGAATASEQIAVLRKDMKKPSGDKARAKRLYKEVLRAYPETEMAKQSKRRLEALGGE